MPSSRQSRASGSSRPNSRERIETIAALRFWICKPVPPGLTAGSGLKHFGHGCVIAAVVVPPGLTAGSGLKHLVTNSCACKWHVPPGLTAGSGLKLSSAHLLWRAVEAVPPGLTAGSGLKQDCGSLYSLHVSSSRPNSRERIETGGQASNGVGRPWFLPA